LRFVQIFRKIDAPELSRSGEACVFRFVGRAWSWRRAVSALIFAAAMGLPGNAEAGGAHLYVMLGFAGLSPGLTDFGERIGHRGIPTTVGSYGEWPTFAEEAIQGYKSGRITSIMIVGHSLGGGAARAMAAELGKAHVPVKLLVTLDPVGEQDVSKNVRRSVNILPGAGEDHFSMIEAHARELNGYMLGGGGDRSARRAHACRRRRTSTPDGAPD
jgi:pimeloyl-ACP methyl ester carboxylesterase